MHLKTRSKTMTLPRESGITRISTASTYHYMASRVGRGSQIDRLVNPCVVWVDTRGVNGAVGKDIYFSKLCIR
jgi:hypothetical protein